MSRHPANGSKTTLMTHTGSRQLAGISYVFLLLLDLNQRSWDVMAVIEPFTGVFADLVADIGLMSMN